MTYALDTNIVINYLRNEPNIHKHFNNAILCGEKIVIPKIVDYEIRRGFRILNAPNKEKAYKILIGESNFCGIAEMNFYCWKRAEHVYEELYRKGFTIGEMDILIASICLENDYTLITNNVKHFKDVDGLNIENWITKL